MRVIAGKWGGRALVSPRGTATRPTTDRVREAMFSSLDSRLGGLDGAVVLDLYAGTGALGIEALSRGADRVVFVESAPAATSALRRNLRALGAGAPEARVLDRQVERAADALAGVGASLLLADPPYRIDAGEFSQVLEALAASGAIAVDAVVVYEHAADSQPVWPRGFAGGTTRRYGDTAVSYATYEG